jgi:hypothetical protein
VRHDDWWVLSICCQLPRWHVSAYYPSRLIGLCLVDEIIRQAQAFAGWVFVVAAQGCAVLQSDGTAGISCRYDFRRYTDGGQLSFPWFQANHANGRAASAQVCLSKVSPARQRHTEEQRLVSLRMPGVPNEMDSASAQEHQTARPSELLKKRELL